MRRYADQNMIRLWNPATRSFLHLSGEGETPNILNAWLGYRKQARALRDQMKAQGKTFPYQPLDRSKGKPAP